jgi:Cu(I)/Ag(I) efflux system periplasmic protein CusF
MKKTLMIAALVTAPITLSGCDKQPDAPKAESPKAETSADKMGDMAMPADVKMAKGTGTVTALDQAAGKITLDHGVIPTVGWPAMKMGFSAKPDLLAGIAVGDKVDFDLIVTGSAGVVTKIQKQ